MAPPSATGAVILPEYEKGEEAGTATHEPGLTEAQARKSMRSFPGPPKFDDKYKEREYLKGRLVLAFRIFAKLGFDEGVAGHITLRVRVPGPHAKLESSTDEATGSCRTYIILG